MEMILRRDLFIRMVAGFLAGNFVVGLFLGGAQPEAVGLFPPPWDKLAHAMAFGGFAVLLDLALWPPAWLLVALPLLVSALDEVHQAFLPGREASVEDWLAGTTGVAIVFMLLRHTRLRAMVDWLRG